MFVSPWTENEIFTTESHAVPDGIENSLTQPRATFHPSVGFFGVVVLIAMRCACDKWGCFPFTLRTLLNDSIHWENRRTQFSVGGGVGTRDYGRSKWMEGMSLRNSFPKKKNFQWLSLLLPEDKLKRLHTNTQKDSLTCCCKPTLAPLVRHYLIQCHSLFGIRLEDFTNEAKHECVQLTPWCDCRIFVVPPCEIFLAANRRLIPW